MLLIEQRKDVSLGRRVPTPLHPCQHLFLVRERVPHLFSQDYIKTWLRSHRCASDTQIRTASQSLQWNRKIQCGNSCRRMLALFELFGAVFLFIWCGNVVPTRLC